MSEFKFSINFSALRSIPLTCIIHAHDNFQNTSILLENLLTTIYNPLQIIIVNDRSLNKEYFNQLVEKYKFINLLVNEKDYSNAINIALDASENDWIFYINNKFIPRNNMWCTCLFNTMQSLKNQGVKLVSPFIDNNNFFNHYKDSTKDIVLEDHFLPFNLAFFHKDLFRIIGKLDKFDNLVDISKFIYDKMNKKNYKQAICRKSLFI